MSDAGPKHKRKHVRRQLDVEAPAPINPWDLQPHESPEAWGAWLVYRDLPEDAEDGYRVVAEKLSCSLTTVAKHGKRWSWPDRRKVYRSHLAALRENARLRGIRRVESIVESRRVEQVETDLDTAGELRRSATRLLTLAHDAEDALRPHLHARVQTRKGDDGEIIEIHPIKVSPRDIAALHKAAADQQRVATELERTALGLTGSRVEVEHRGKVEVDQRVSGEVTITHQVRIEDLTTEQLNMLELLASSMVNAAPVPSTDPRLHLPPATSIAQ